VQVLHARREAGRVGESSALLPAALL